MSVHTLYRPTTIPTTSSVRKTKALTDAVTRLEGEAQDIKAKIAEINSSHSPLIEPTRQGLLKCQGDYRALSKKARELKGGIERTELVIADLMASLVGLKKEADGVAAEIDVVMLSRDDAEKAVVNAEAACAKVTSKLHAHHTDRLAEIDKAKYRLSQHLARHPASALIPETPPPKSTAQESRRDQKL